MSPDETKPNDASDGRPHVDPPVRGQLLLVDDEEEILGALRRQFRRRYDVHTAASAGEGLEILYRHPIHVIISDQRMPGMTGDAFYSKVRSDYPDAIRLLLTGYSDIGAVIRAINEGSVYRYITKPWDPAELDATVDQAFERFGLIVQNRQLVADLQDANEHLEARVVERTSALQEANERLQSLNEQKDGFLGMAAHDLRNPLGNVLGYAQLLRAETILDDGGATRAVQAIERSARRMLHLVDDLLDIAKIERGKIELRVEDVDVPKFLSSIEELNAPIARAKRIELVTKLGPDVTTWGFDPLRLEQVINNLITNAIKFSFPETEVRLEAQVLDGDLELAVVDHGQGIPESELEGVFGEFSLTSTQSTAGEKGSGLGLAICRRIVALHGGAIAVQSEVDVGSRFSVRLPGETS